ncbi:MAG: hypothetical protein WAV52_05045 [Luteococcus japonicus]
MAPTMLVLLGLAAVCAILALIIKAKAHPFIAMIVVSIALALVAGMPMAAVIPTLQEGMGKTLGSVALIVTLGAMLGKIIEISGGAEVLAKALLRAFGEKRAPWALGASAFIFGIPWASTTSPRSCWCPSCSPSRARCPAAPTCSPSPCPP